MNKKFFAALTSATMAFTASGSIAVFADDFVEENTPVVDGELKPIPATVVWNEENFGELVNGKVTFNGEFSAPAKDTEIKTSDLKKVTSILLATDFKGEVKGLEYFTELSTFNATYSAIGNPAYSQELKNKTLDFSANTKLKTLLLTTAYDLTDITLPNPEVKEDEKEVYNFYQLQLENTKLTSLDLSAQEGLGWLQAINNANLKEVSFRAVTKDDKAAFSKLDLSNNALETVNLDNYTITDLNLSNNHIGALDLRDATLNGTTTLTGQTFYVSELVANVNLKDAFPALNVNKVTANGTAKFDGKTGVLTLAETGDTTYNYATDSTHNLVVTLEVANPMNRLYNPNSGEHFYTASIAEKEALVALGWKDEGYGWVAAQTPATDQAKKAQAVYRLYNANAGDHHYTMNENEVKTLVAYGWKDEGTGWYSDADEAVPVYRQYNPFANGAGSHNYTTDKAENDYLVSLGWTPEGKAWYAVQ